MSQSKREMQQRWLDEIRVRTNVVVNGIFGHDGAETYFTLSWEELKAITEPLLAQRQPAQHELGIYDRSTGEFQPVDDKTRIGITYDVMTGTDWVHFSFPQDDGASIGWRHRVSKR